MLVHPKKQAQVGALLFNKAPTEILVKSSNYSNIFSAENVAELRENTGINEHTIELKKGKQPLFSPIYCLGPVEMETLKIYIKTNLANGFLQPYKSLAGVPILFDRKPDRSLCLYMDYWGLNNITIKKPISAISDWQVAGLAQPDKEIHLVGSH